MKKNVINAIVVIMILLISVFLIYDINLRKDENINIKEKEEEKQNSDVKQKEEEKVQSENSNIKENQAQNSNLQKIKQLIDKYNYNSLYGVNLFLEGLGEDTKILITLNRIPKTEIINNISCSTLYQNDENAVYESNGYKVNLNVYVGNKGSFCYTTTYGISYESASKVYKDLFGSNNDMPKKDVVGVGGTYDFKDDYFYELTYLGGGYNPNIGIYGIKDVQLNDDELIVYIGYLYFQLNYEKNTYSPSFDKTIEYTAEDLKNDSVVQEYTQKHYDKMNKSKWIFINDNGNYVLKDINILN